jgi:NCAIR mutase (PurE)-related protein
MPPDVEQLARELVAGQISPTELVRRLTNGATLDLGEVQLDVDRERRCGYAEVIYAEGKSVETLRRVVRAIVADGREALATRVSVDQAAGVAEQFSNARYNGVARTLRVAPDSIPHAPREDGITRSVMDKIRGRVAVITAGTSDLPVAEEARETADWTGACVNFIPDVGVAGPQRLRERLGEFSDPDAVVVVAGMEGALPSVVAGHVRVPVIAVPTSVGYGANFGGLAALFSMLNSCAANVCVVNIDAGFKAGYLAGMIAARTARPHQVEG